jgi:hypothetical protein
MFYLNLSNRFLNTLHICDEVKAYLVIKNKPSFQGIALEHMKAVFRSEIVLLPYFFLIACLVLILQYPGPYLSNMISSPLHDLTTLTRDLRYM